MSTDALFFRGRASVSHSQPFHLDRCSFLLFTFSRTIMSGNVRVVVLDDSNTVIRQQDDTFFSKLRKKSVKLARTSIIQESRCVAFWCANALTVGVCTGVLFLRVEIVCPKQEKIMDMTDSMHIMQMRPDFRSCGERQHHRHNSGMASNFRGLSKHLSRRRLGVTVGRNILPTPTPSEPRAFTQRRQARHANCMVT